jgi:hypothetical protein
LLVLSDGRKIARFAETDYEKGFKYLESLITETGDSLERHRVSPVIYRCEAMPIDANKKYQIPVDCKPASSVQSDYLVKTNIIIFGRAGIGIVKNMGSGLVFQHDLG